MARSEEVGPARGSTRRPTSIPTGVSRRRVVTVVAVTGVDTTEGGLSIIVVTGPLGPLGTGLYVPLT